MTPAHAIEFLQSLPGPWVVKTDGLAAGKGVLVTDDLDLAIADARAKLSGTAFGPAGHRVVIEEGLVGRELSVMAVCDGVRAVALVPAQDFKRVGEGDTGPNTGGMGAYSPVPAAGPDVLDEVFDVAIRADAGGSAGPRHRVPGGPVRRPHAHRARAPASSSSTCGSAIRRARWCCCAGRGM